MGIIPWIGLHTDKWSNESKHTEKWNNETMDITKSFENVESLDINNVTGELNIVIGEDFIVEAENVTKSFKAEVTSDGTLTITDNKDGFHFPWFFFGGSDSPNSKVTLYLPSDFIAEDADIETGAGNVTIKGLQCEELQLSAGAGNINGKDITADNVDIEGGVGHVTMEYVHFTNAVMECGVGNLDISGTLLGKTDIDCGIGGVELNISGNSADYGFDIESGVGSSRLNGKKLSRDYSSNMGAPNIIEIDGGVGSVNINMEE